jgi:lipopolysaccharide export system permease protein
MKTVRRLIWRDVIWSVMFVSVAFLSLFFFTDFLGELEDVSKRGYPIWAAVAGALLKQPVRFYELFPITVLIGTIYAMARLAESSEFTILRTGGLGPWRALSLLLSLGLIMAALTFVIGEYVAPYGDRQANALKAQLRGGNALGGAGAWLKEHRPASTVLTPTPSPSDASAITATGERNISINVRGTEGATGLSQIRIFEHDERGHLIRRIEAPSAQVAPTAQGSVWQLKDAVVSEWPADASSALQQRKVASLAWHTSLDERLVAAAVSPIDSMSTPELWRYMQHLNEQEQTAQRYELQFWKRVLYPFACIVMLALALPFAYLHARSGGISLKVFGGIMLGISFVLLNNVVGHLSLLRDWTPWLAALAPSLLYLALSMAAFVWLVRYR